MESRGLFYEKSQGNKYLESEIGSVDQELSNVAFVEFVL